MNENDEKCKTLAQEVTNKNYNDWKVNKMAPAL